MSFSGNLRAEAARTIPSAKRDRDTAIAALIANICSFSETEEGVIRMRFSAGNLFAVRKCFTLIQKNVNIIPVETIDEVLEIAFTLDKTYEKETVKPSKKRAAKKSENKPAETVSV